MVQAAGGVGATVDWILYVTPLGAGGLGSVMDYPVYFTLNKVKCKEQFSPARATVSLPLPARTFSRNTAR